MTHTLIGPAISLVVVPPTPPWPSITVLVQSFPLNVASFKSPVLLSLYATTDFPLKTALARFDPSELSSNMVLFQLACGVTDLVLAATDCPSAFFATIENV